MALGPFEFVTTYGKPARWRAIHAVRPGAAKWYSRAEPRRLMGGLSEQRRPMAEKNRDEFLEKTKLQIAKRAGWLCSDPSCRRGPATFLMCFMHSAYESFEVQVTARKKVVGKRCVPH